MANNFLNVHTVAIHLQQDKYWREINNPWSNYKWGARWLKDPDTRAFSKRELAGLCDLILFLTAASLAFYYFCRRPTVARDEGFIQLFCFLLREKGLGMENYANWALSKQLCQIKMASPIQNQPIEKCHKLRRFHLLIKSNQINFVLYTHCHYQFRRPNFP